MHFARSRHRSSCGFGNVRAEAERRSVDRNGCTSGRTHPLRESSNRGSARAPRFGHHSISFRDTSQARRASSVVSALKKNRGALRQLLISRERHEDTEAFCYARYR
jgi:hypothetical protein